MKTIFLFCAAALSVLPLLPHFLAADLNERSQPFTAAPQVAIHALDD